MIGDKSRSWLMMEVGLLLFVSAAAYLPFLGQLGYYKDDWYLMYSAHAHGPSIFSDVFSIDRPARAVLMSAVYQLFGDNPLFYNLNAYAFRLFGALGFLWALRLLWPGQRRATLLMSLLFLVYPGYLSQPNAIDYQSYTVSLCLACVSIALSFQAVNTERWTMRAALIAVSVLSGWAYLALVEYFIGLEALRILGIALLAVRTDKGGWPSAGKKLVPRILGWLCIPATFLFWRIFVFQNERRATDLGAQLGRLMISPGLTGLWWIVYLVRDTFSAVLLAWSIPMYSFLLQARLRDILSAAAVAGVAVLIVSLYLRTGGPKDEEVAPGSWRAEALWLGLCAAVAGLTPIILANRQVDFGEFSRYALPAAAGGVMALVGLIHYLSEGAIRTAILSALIFSAGFVHYVNGARAAQEAEAVSNFWWQVSWRAPQISSGTTLIARYAAGNIPEDYVIWGPANLVYYPDYHAEAPVETDLSAAVLTHDSIANVLIGHPSDLQTGRGTISSVDYKNILVLTQPGPTSCAQILDGDIAELSAAEDPGIVLIAPQSRIENVLSEAPPRTPPPLVFGPEPEHSWCYYYQKASLARQRADWDVVVQLEHQAAEQGLHPSDQIEWMPFLQAYARLDDLDQVKAISKKINTDRYYKYQACRNLRTMTGLSPEMQSSVEQLFCGSE